MANFQEAPGSYNSLKKTSMRQLNHQTCTKTVLFFLIKNLYFIKKKTKYSDFEANMLCHPQVYTVCVRYFSISIGCIRARSAVCDGQGGVAPRQTARERDQCRTPTLQGSVPRQRPLKVRPVPVSTAGELQQCRRLVT